MSTHTILNTRPATQAAPLSTALTASGHQVIELPCLNISAIEDSSAFEHALSINYDYMLFVSQHAVTSLAPYWRPTTAKIIAIGPSTQQAIHAIHKPTLVPSVFSSAGILAMDDMQHVQNKKILLVCGDHTNNPLAATLRGRGAIVDTLITYRVTVPKIDIGAALTHCQQQQVNLIISTSQASLKQLVQWFEPRDAQWLFQQPVVVISRALANAAQQHGWKKNQIIQSPNATTEAIVETIRTC